MNITLGHKHKEPLGGTWIWRVQVNGPVPFRSSSTQTKGQIHDKIRCVWCKEDGEYESEDLDLWHQLNKMIIAIDNTSDVVAAEV